MSGAMVADPWAADAPAPAANPNAGAVSVAEARPATPEELAQQPQPAPPSSADGIVADPWAGQGGETPPPQLQPPLKSDQGLGFMAGITKPLDNAATWLENIPGVRQADQAVAGAFGMPSTDQAIANHQTALADAAAQGRKPGALGQFAGGFAASLPIGLATANPLLAGGAIGALDTNDPNNLQGTATSAALGAAGGKLGDMAMRGVGAMVAPRLSSAVRTLMGSGVTLTPGQILGGAAKKFEDAASSVPLVGDFIKHAQDSALVGFNRATVQQALDHVGETLPDNVKTGHDALAYASGKMSDAYEKALPGIKVSPDADYALELHNVRKDTNVLAPDDQDHVNRIIDNLVMPRFSYGSAMTGDAMKALDSKLGSLARQYPGPVADSVRSVQAAVRDAVERQNPMQAPALKAANAGYAKLIRAETAAASQAAGKTGIFTAPQLMGAVKRGDSSIRDRAFSHGDALMQDWAGAGSKVLPSSVPDSGSANRGMVGALILGGGHAAHMLLNPMTGVPLAGLTAAYTKTGQAALRAAILSRPSWAPQARGLLSNFETPAGILGAQAAQPVTQGLLPSPAP